MRQVRADDDSGDLWLSFLLHYDGTSVAKSSRLSLEPIQLQIIELPPKVRCSYENMVLAGLFVGSSQPFDIRALTDHLADEIEAWNRNPSVVTYRVRHAKTC